MLLLFSANIIFSKQTTFAPVDKEGSIGHKSIPAEEQLSNILSINGVIETIYTVEVMNPTIMAVLKDTEIFGDNLWFGSEYASPKYDDSYSLLDMSVSYLHGEPYILETGERLDSDMDPMLQH
ncbi:hypothetical protein [Candidatus Enterococcus clewellii]|uniref:Uncharacterized protein n=1 Tax=Candidatus Enterococcus clewellii TaxID=1834193 RepID=A0A242JZ93_9ENTE|nr:hypothetical protein A5888_003937 [Enterococcus sp. 9E7_DIV0242]